MKQKFVSLGFIFALVIASLAGCGQVSRGALEESGATEMKTVYQSFADSVSSIPPFQAADLDGEKVDESIFEKADITVVNCWGTFCTPCIDEMPDLAAWSKDMPENVQMVGIVCDYMEGLEGVINRKQAQKICDKAGVDFIQIVPDASLQEILVGVVAYPTTFFVDRSGNVVGEVIEGADLEAYKNVVNTYLEEHPNAVSGQD